MKRYILILTLFITACTYKIELPIDMMDGKLFVEAFPIAGTDTTYFNICPTRPANLPRGKDSGYLNIISINLTVNGEKCIVKKKESYNGKYFSTRRFAKGDMLGISIEAKNYPPIASTLVIPEGPDYKLERRLETEGVHHRFIFPDSSNDKRYHYGVRIARRFNYEEVSWESGNAEYRRWQKYETLTPKIVYSSSGEKIDIPGYRDIQTIKLGGISTVIMGNIEGIDNELEILISHVNNRYDHRSQTDTLIRRIQYKIEVLSIDSDTYKYLNPQINYYLLSAGLVPPFTNTSNITGGYGMFGRIGISSTGWIDNIDTEIY